MLESNLWETCTQKHRHFELQLSNTNISLEIGIFLQFVPFFCVFAFLQCNNYNQFVDSRALSSKYIFLFGKTCIMRVTSPKKKNENAVIYYI